MHLSPRFQPVPAHLLHVGRTITTVWGMKILMIERERERSVGNEWVLGDAATTVVLQWEQYFPYKTSALLSSAPMWPNHHNGWLSAQTQRDKTIHQGDTVPRKSSLVSLQVLGAEMWLCPIGGRHIRGQSMTHRNSSGKTETGTCSCRQMLKIPFSCSLDKS